MARAARCATACPRSVTDHHPNRDNRDIIMSRFVENMWRTALQYIRELRPHLIRMICKPMQNRDSATSTCRDLRVVVIATRAVAICRDLAGKWRDYNTKV